MQKYVLGFMFDKKAGKVVLIKKIKPAWQKGLYNGVGGKVEDYDATSAAAMKREFLEETGVFCSSWHKLLEMKENNIFSVEVFYTFSDCIDLVKTIEEEVVEVVNINSQWDMIRSKSISNVPWLIMACLDADAETGRLKLAVEYT